jgi:hypothetical protein
VLDKVIVRAKVAMATWVVVRKPKEKELPDLQ